MQEDGLEHPPLQPGMPEGGTRQEMNGAVGGGRRCGFGDAGENGGVEARPREMWVLITGRISMEEQAWENRHGRIHMRRKR